MVLTSSRAMPEMIKVRSFTPLFDQIAVNRILAAEILGAGAADIIFMIGQDAALHQAIPAGGEGVVSGEWGIGSERGIGRWRVRNRRCNVATRQARLGQGNGPGQTQLFVPLLHYDDASSLLLVFRIPEGIIIEFNLGEPDLLDAGIRLWPFGLQRLFHLRPPLHQLVTEQSARTARPG